MKFCFKYWCFLIIVMTLLFSSSLTFNIIFAEKLMIESLPSGKNTGMPYKWTINTWDDFCPLCEKYDCLLINPKGVYESELTCKYCDADYCGSSGLDKSLTPRTRLTK